MSVDVEKEMAALRQMQIGELRAEYARVFGEATTSRNCDCLIRRILWRKQAAEQGGLSQRARERVEELANEAELRLTAPKPAAAPARDARCVTVPIPPAIRDAEAELAVGAQFQRLYQGRMIVVTIVENGVRWNGTLYRSLSAVAKTVTGAHWNGRQFFNLTPRVRT